jgi:D-aminopeptidase
VKPPHVFDALESASDGPVGEGNVGGGTGMICHGFKGGIGTASRVLSEKDGGYAVGVLVQANYGDRERLAIEGVPIGREIPPERVPVEDVSVPPDRGSIIIVVATDAPLLPHQLHRVAQRAGLGVARLGGAGENGSGDIFIAFSTANRGLAGGGTRSVEMLGNDAIDPLFYAAIEATEEAIVNALLQAETMTGKGGSTAHRLDPELLADLVRRAGTA